MGAALDGVSPGIADVARPMLGPPATASYDGHETLLINKLTARGDDLVLVLDYLMDEVLGEQTEDVTAFLLETSVPDRLSGALDALIDRTDSQARLGARNRTEAVARARELGLVE